MSAKLPQDGGCRQCLDCRADYVGECYRHMLVRFARENIAAGARTSNRTRPQWQPPACMIMSLIGFSPFRNDPFFWPAHRLQGTSLLKKTREKLNGQMSEQPVIQPLSAMTRVAGPNVFGIVPSTALTP